MSAGQDTPIEQPTGLRARKKQRTRDELMRVALQLFTTQGYEATTVDEIAEAVEVSQRTFFRYFASKEDVAFGIVLLVEGQFVEQLRLRPADEGPILAMRSAVSAGWEKAGGTIEEIASVELVMKAYQMIESTPALLSAHLRHGSETEEEIVRIIAEREGLDVERDPRPRAAVAAVCGVLRMAGRIWGQPGHETSVDSLVDLTQRYLDALVPSLGSDWGPRTTEPVHTRCAEEADEEDEGDRTGKAGRSRIGDEKDPSGRADRGDAADTPDGAGQERGDRGCDLTDGRHMCPDGVSVG